jgi:hypothetical protein
MAITMRRKAAAAVLAATAAMCGIVAMAATSASASGDPTPPAAQQATPGGGAYDLNGNPVQTKTYVGDTPPADLGTLEQSGTATVGSGPVTGTLSP